MKKIIFLLAMFFTISAYSQKGVQPSSKIPSQAGNSGKVLSTNGSKLNWLSIPTPTYAAGISAALTGSGTVNYLPMYSSSNTFTNSSIQTYTNGITNFNSTLDGESSGINNITYSVTTGGLRVGYYSQSGMSTLQQFYTNGVNGTIITEGTGLYSVASKNRFSIKNATTNTTKFQVDMSSGFIGIGDDYFTPSARLHVYQNTIGTSAKAFKVDIATYGELFSIDDNTYLTYNGLGATFRGSNGIINLVSNGGANPQLFFKMSDGAFTNGSIRGDNYDLIINANKRVNIDAIFHLNTSTTPVAPTEGDIYQDGTHIYCYLAGAWKQIDN